MNEEKVLQFTLTDGAGAKHTLSMPYALPDLAENVLVDAIAAFKELDLFAKNGEKLYVNEKSIQYVKTTTEIVSDFK